MNVRGVINYSAHAGFRPRYYANDHSRDRLALEPIEVEFVDGRREVPALDREGFVLLRHSLGAAPETEVERLLRDLTGADSVVVSGGAVKRFSEQSPDAGQHDNSYPARFVHIDVSDATAAAFAERSCPQGKGEPRRWAHYNVWRVVSPPPQDVPLGLCDARTLAPQDLIAADAIFDAPDKPEWSFEGLVIGANPAHRWLWFPDMSEDELIVFKTNDSDPGQPHHVPHSAFTAEVPPDTPPRASIEMRAIAYWF